jgi:phosphohistidine phosphatase SixA
LVWKEREDTVDHRFWVLRYSIVSASFAVFILAFVHLAEAQQVIFLVRHAEQSLEGEDPALTEAGRRRATALAALLKDAAINAIFESGIRRTRETAKPLADALNVELKTYPRTDIGGFIGILRSEHAQDRVLIVTQSLRISRWLKVLGSSVDITVAPTDYDNILVVIPRGDGAPLVLRLRY